MKDTNNTKVKTGEGREGGGRERDGPEALHIPLETIKNVLQKDNIHYFFECLLSAIVLNSLHKSTHVNPYNNPMRYTLLWVVSFPP